MATCDYDASRYAVEYNPSQIEHFLVTFFQGHREHPRNPSLNHLSRAQEKELHSVALALQNIVETLNEQSTNTRISFGVEGFKQYVRHVTCPENVIFGGMDGNERQVAMKAPSSSTTRTLTKWDWQVALYFVVSLVLLYVAVSYHNELCEDLFGVNVTDTVRHTVSEARKVAAETADELGHVRAQEELTTARNKALEATTLLGKGIWMFFKNLFARLYGQTLLTQYTVIINHLTEFISTENLGSTLNDSARSCFPVYNKEKGVFDFVTKASVQTGMDVWNWVQGNPTATGDCMETSAENVLFLAQSLLQFRIREWKKNFKLKNRIAMFALQLGKNLFIQSVKYFSHRLGIYKLLPKPLKTGFLAASVAVAPLGTISSSRYGLAVPPEPLRLENVPVAPLVPEPEPLPLAAASEREPNRIVPPAAPSLKIVCPICSSEYKLKSAFDKHMAKHLDGTIDERGRPVNKKKGGFSLRHFKKCSPCRKTLRRR